MEARFCRRRSECRNTHIRYQTISNDVKARKILAEYIHLPVFREGELEMVKENISKTKGIDLSSAVVTESIIGGICFRRFDNAYSSQSKTLTERFGERPSPKPSYY